MSPVFALEIAAEVRRAQNPTKCSGRSEGCSRTLNALRFSLRCLNAELNVRMRACLAFLNLIFQATEKTNPLLPKAFAQTDLARN